MASDRPGAGFPVPHWNARGPLAIALLPFAALFGGIVALRRRAYSGGWRRPERLTVPVIAIGNFTVGGAGKTPLTIWLVEQLRAAGFRPGVVSCGYRGSARAPMAVTAASDPRECGDEPVLIARRTGVPGWINRDRARAAHALLAAHPDVNVIVCDDALQHLRLARDIEIAVVDRRGYGNRWLMPAGPLREPPRPTDALVLNGAEAGAEAGAAAPQGATKAFAMTLEVDRLYAVDVPERTVDPRTLSGRCLHAVAGIGSPARFFDSLASLGLAFTPHAFPDHHAFVPSDLAFADADTILMTEKDAVKCALFEPTSVRARLVALQVSARVDAALMALITQLLSKLRKPDGSPIA